jgi:hypothetical protein
MDNEAGIFFATLVGLPQEPLPRDSLWQAEWSSTTN